MRKLLVLAIIGGIAYWFLNRGSSADGQTVTIGYVDGSAVVLEPGSPGFERLAAVARSAIRT